MTKEEKSANGKKWRQENAEYVKEKRKLDYQKNKEKENEYGKKYRKNNPEKLKIYKDKTEIKRKEYHKNYRTNNKEKVTIAKNKSHKKRIAVDPLYKLTKNIRNLIGMIFTNMGFGKKTKSAQILGCTFEEFKLHLESKFEDWMTWENYGVYNPNRERTWNIDHIIPVSLAKTEEEIIKLNHFSNLRPLCSRENNMKSNNLLKTD